MDDHFRSNMRTPLPSIGRNSLYGRQSLYNQGRNSVRPSDVGRLSYGNNVLQTGTKKSLTSQMAGKISKPARNPRDKPAIEENKAILREFLVQRESKLDLNFLNNPTSNFFISTFEFIYLQLDPDYDVKKVPIKDEFPKVMSILGYPTTIKASTMASVSTGTSWPYILDALAWLASFVKKSQDLDVVAFTNSEDGDNLNRYYSYEYFTKCYKKFKHEHVNSPEDFKPELEMFRQSVIQSDKLSELDEISKEKASLEYELEELKKGCCEEECEDLEIKIACIQKDYKGIIDYVQQAKECYENRVQVDQALQVKVNETEAQLQKIQAENDKKRERIRNQKISAKQVREANVKLANGRERLTQSRAELKRWLEDAPKLQSTIYKILNLIRDKISDISADIVRIADDFFTQDEQRLYGFNEIRNTRAMDNDACKERLKLLGELRNKLLAKMDATMQQNRDAILKKKEVETECDLRVQKAEIALMKFDQDLSAQVKEEKRKNDDLRQKCNQAEHNSNIATQKLDIIAGKLHKIENDIASLQQELAELQVFIDRRKCEIETERDDLAVNAADEAGKLYLEHNRNKAIQKEQDEKMNTLLSRHVDLIKFVNNLDIEDDTTGKPF